MHPHVRRTAPAQTEMAAPFVADIPFSLAGIMSVSMGKKWFMWRYLSDIKLELLHLCGSALGKRTKI